MINIDNIINAPLITSPWSHKIIDNIFDDKSFEVINQAASHLSHLCVSDETIPVHIDEAIALGISNESANLILDTADLLLYNLKEIVGKNCLNGAFRGGYFIMPKFGITGRNFQYPIHDESIYKIINLVTYLQPKESVGTRLYSGPDRSEFVTQIPWKPNRAALFYPKHRVTWHNWQGQPTNEPRITLNFFVQRIEALKDTLYKDGEPEDALDSLLWFYEKIGQDRLTINIE
jgi:hypothetical protein